MLARIAKSTLLCVALAAHVLLAGYHPSARAEDTDIFTVNPALASARPNVLIILDNTANWNTPFVAEKSALVSTVQGLDDRFNVGLMGFVETGSPNDNIDGSYVRAAVRQMTDTNKTKLAAMVNAFDQGWDKGNNATYGLAMAEAYRYFGGRTSVSGFGKVKRDYAGNSLTASGNNANANPTLAYSNALWALPGNAYTSATSSTYVSPIADDCAKNFIIFISNGPAMDNNSSTTTATAALAGYGGSTAEIPLSPNGEQSNVGDEWARFMANSDVNPTRTLTQNVYTYTVDVNPGTTGQGPSHTALLKSMATQGKGKYFAVTTNSADIADALNKIFTEILSINSVFASSALPASVNTRGTFLNQVYMGVFRPDGNASPRWPGNLKQYKLKPNSADQLELVDRADQPVENASTGFISETAKSFWSAASTFWDASYYPDVQGKGGVSDEMDGNLVEKGGAAYRLRATYPTDLSNRKLYTCIDTCTADSALSDYPFSTSNAALTAMAGTTFGIPGTVGVTVARSSSTATATTVGGVAHNYTVGQAVNIAGADQSEYNGLFTVTGVPTASTFTYTVPLNPPMTATGTIQALKVAASLTPTSLTRVAGSSAGVTDTATLTFAAAHGLTGTQTIVVSGATQPEYNGTFSASVASVNTLTYVVPVTPGAPTAFGNAAFASTSKRISALSRSGLTVTVDTNGPVPAASGNVTITGMAPTGYNGTFAFTRDTTNNKRFTYQLSSLAPSSPAGGTVSVSVNPATYSVTSLVRGSANASSIATATATTSSAHTLAVGGTVSISGANEPAYNGVFQVTAVTSNTFQYQLTVSPALTATGTITASASSGVTKNDLINWVRGANVQLDDNPTGLANTVRGYLHGDVVHSRPLAINYNRSGQPANRDIVVFYGSNDGVFHAVKGGQDDADGQELWGFIPSELFPQLARQFQESPVIDNASSATAKPYFIDGPISTMTIDANNDGAIDSGTAGDKAYLYLTMRRAGRFMYALDVTNPTAPKYLWKISATGAFSELGQTWGEAKVATLRGATNKVLVISAGYDAAANDTATQGTATMGRGVYVVDAVTGSPLWYAGAGSPSGIPATLSVPGMTYAIAADPTVIDSDGDGYADRIYLADTGGNIWRVNIGAVTSGGAPDYAAWTVDKLAALGGDGRKFLFPVDVVPFDDPVTKDAILVGSGNREAPFEVSAQNRFFMIKDSHDKFARPASEITASNLCNLTANSIQVGDATAAAADKTCLTSSSGWYIDLLTGEKVVTSAVTLNGATTFGTNRPESTLTNTSRTECSSGLGEARLYTISFKDATSVIDQNADGLLQTADRYTVSKAGGYPPSPVGISVQIDGKYYEGVSSGPKIIHPPGPEVGRRTRVFWNINNEAN